MDRGEYIDYIKTARSGDTVWIGLGMDMLSLRHEERVAIVKQLRIDIKNVKPDGVEVILLPMGLEVEVKSA